MKIPVVLVGSANVVSFLALDAPGAPFVRRNVTVHFDAQRG